MISRWHRYALLLSDGDVQPFNSTVTTKKEAQEVCDLMNKGTNTLLRFNNGVQGKVIQITLHRERLQKQLPKVKP